MTEALQSFLQIPHTISTLSHRVTFGRFLRFTRSADPAWLMPEVSVLAQSIYDRCAFEKLPQLANRLEQAGCNVGEVLAHLRSIGRMSLPDEYAPGGAVTLV